MNKRYNGETDEKKVRTCGFAGFVVVLIDALPFVFFCFAFGVIKFCSPRKCLVSSTFLYP